MRSSVHSRAHCRGWSRTEDLRGILHAHTDRSDGVDTLEAMAEATRARGYQYFGVADHSKSAHYAGGLSVEEIDEQHRDIDRLNKRYGRDFRIFKGIESDILADGSLDYPDEVLARFDFVVASVHSRFKLDRETQTAAHHPRGRKSLHHHPRPHDRTAVAAPAGLRDGHRDDPRRLRRSTASPSKSTPTRGGSIWTGAGIGARSSSAA